MRVKFYKICAWCQYIPCGLLFAVSWLSGMLGFWQGPFISTVLLIFAVIGIMKEENIDVIRGICCIIVFSMLFWLLYLTMYM